MTIAADVSITEAARRNPNIILYITMYRETYSSARSITKLGGLDIDTANSEQATTTKATRFMLAIIIVLCTCRIPPLSCAAAES